MQTKNAQVANEVDQVKRRCRKYIEELYASGDIRNYSEVAANDEDRVFQYERGCSILNSMKKWS